MEKLTVQWALYMMDNVLRCTGLDVAEIYNIKLSVITPQTYGACLFTLLIRHAIAFGVINLLFYSWKLSRGQSFCTTTRGCSWICIFLPYIKGLVFEQKGQRISSQLPPVDVNNFVKQFNEEAQKQWSVENDEEFTD